MKGYWGPHELTEFYQYWDSPQRKINGEKKKAAYDAMSPAEQKKHDRNQKELRRGIRDKEKGKISKYGPGRDESNHKILPYGSAYEQQKARLADPNSKRNMKRAKRREKQRMAGERMEYEMNKYDKRKDYKMS